MSVSFVLRGTNAMIAKMRRITLAFPLRAQMALLTEGEHIMTDSKRNYVPWDLGALATSGVVLPPVRVGKMITVHLVYGSAAAAYALAVHEHPSSTSPASWQGKAITWSQKKGGGRRGPKYLERPMKNAQRGMAARIARRIKVG